MRATDSTGMTISSVSSISQQSQSSTSATSLATQLAKVSVEITKTASDKSLDGKTKAAKIQALQARQVQLQAQMDRLKVQQQAKAAPAAQKTSTPAEPAAKSENSTFHTVA